MGWPQNTRKKQIPLPSKTTTATTGETLSWDIPKTGILAALSLIITGTVTGTPSTPNALGQSNLLTRTRLIGNAGINLIDISGPGYHYGMRDMVELLGDPVPQSDGRSVVASGAIDLSEYFPLALNSRDPLGAILLQNEDTQLRLEVEVAALTALANDYTALSLTVVPELDIFTVPTDPKDWPSFDFAMTISEESQSVSGAGEVTWNWPRGNIYAQVCHLLGIGASGADAWSAYKLRVNQSDYIYDTTPAGLTRRVSRYRGKTRVAGTIPIDLLAESGMGNYGSGRDMIDSRRLTDIASVITATSAATLRTVKRQIVPLRTA